jgi:hypothetical protein
VRIARTGSGEGAGSAAHVDLAVLPEYERENAAASRIYIHYDAAWTWDRNGLPPAFPDPPIVALLLRHGRVVSSAIPVLAIGP